MAYIEAHMIGMCEEWKWSRRRLRTAAAAAMAVAAAAGVTTKVVNALCRNYGTDTIEMGTGSRAQIR